jgi:hypothetical protein
MACRLAFDARILWNAAQEHMRTTGQDDLPLREYVRGLLAGALALAKDALKASDTGAGAFVRLRQEADRLRQELLATELPWDESNSLRVDPKALAQAQVDTARRCHRHGGMAS